MADRTVSMKGLVFGRTANTTIPNDPYVGTGYRNPNINDSNVKNGWAFSTVVDSAVFNEYLYRISSLVNQVEKEGILEYSSLTDYPQGGLCKYNGNLFRALLASGPSTGGVKDPTNTSYWTQFSGGGSSGGGLESVAHDDTLTGAGTSVSPLAVNLDKIGSVLAGTFCWYCGVNVPGGYLVCDGASISKTTYATLFNAIGYNFTPSSEQGADKTNFRLPNLMTEQRFIRSVQTSSQVGTTQQESMNIPASNVGEVVTTTIGPSGVFTQGASTGYVIATAEPNLQPLYGVSMSSQGTETRPDNIWLLPIIKY